MRTSKNLGYVFRGSTKKTTNLFSDIELHKKWFSSMVTKTSKY